MRRIKLNISHLAKLRSYSLLFVILFFHASGMNAQTDHHVYHTPSGTRYHTAKCHMVDNTSNSILRSEALKRQMKPCTFCKPDENKNTQVPPSINPTPKPGQKEIASQCLGKTQEGVRCERKTKNANGYCFQHLPSTRT